MLHITRNWRLDIFATSYYFYENQTINNDESQHLKKELKDNTMNN